MQIYNVSNNNQFNSSTIEKTSTNGQQTKNTEDKEIKEEYIQMELQDDKITHKNPTYKIDRATIQKLKAESEKNYNHLRELVRQLLERQGMTFQDIGNLEDGIKIDEQARLEAQAMIDEGGPLSPENVSDNIVNFAKAISGGDKSKLDKLKSAIEKGFKEVEDMFGGQLPEISYKTYDLVMQKLDAWEKEEE